MRDKYIKYFDMKEEWDVRYNTKEYRYGLEPNNFYKTVINELQPGKILFPADGEGRNSVYAATQGWEVHAFDYSSVAREKALKLADSRGVTLLYETVSAEDFTTDETFDAIVLIFTHFPQLIRDGFFPKIAGMLKPGGKIIAEIYSKRQLANGTGGPKAEHMLYSKDQFLAYFPELKVELADDWEGYIDEGDLHSGKSDTLRFVLVK